MLLGTSSPVYASRSRPQSFGDPESVCISALRCYGHAHSACSPLLSCPPYRPPHAARTRAAFERACARGAPAPYPHRYM
eukprot:475656-Heterocapsa_arctica.AAC.1